jgi:uncharacterized protein YndB with AHSA1/START domain
MEHIRHRVGISAPPARVYEALATKEGLAGFWTQHIDGDVTPGGTLRFFFNGNPDPGAVMEVVDLAPNQQVRWRCVQGPQEWVGTDLTFELTSGDEETVVLFTHANWREPVEFLHHCSTKWAYFLLGLKTWLEGGASVANPNDMKISSWG